MRLLRLFLLGLFASVVCSCGPLHAQPANVMADPSTGALFRPSAATFISGNSLLTSTAAAAAYQPLNATLTGISGKSTIGTGNLVLATSPTFTTPILGAATATSITGPTTTDLTLQGGSSGASLVLGEGSSVGTATLTAGFSNRDVVIRPTTTGHVLLHPTGNNNPILDFVKNGVVKWEIYSDGSDTLTFRDAVAGSNRITASASTGSITFNSTTASTSTTTGSGIFGGGIGVAGAINAADDISIIGTAATDRTLKIQSLGAQYAQLKMNTNSSTANNFQVLVESGGRVYFQQNNGAINTLQIESTGHATYSKRWNVSDTTSASSSTAGALTIGNGTAATNVAIGGGNVNAGGALTVGGTVIHTLSATPASASAAGTVGTISWDTSYIYICTATNTWKRVAIATW